MTDRTEILKALEHVEDPEIGMNVVDLGLVYGLDWDEDKGKVHIDLTLTAPGCPYGPELIRAIKRELRDLEEVLDVDVELVWRPLWHPSMMSDFAKDELGYDE
jgi:metal-sulfur cluster biosynthetic enzyme